LPRVPQPPSSFVALLSAVAFAAGTVDAVAGGGGLLTVPALLAAGLPPHLALGTNKGQSVFGAGAALLRYARAGMVDRARARVTFPSGLAGSMLGAALLLMVDPSALRQLVLALLLSAALLMLLKREPQRARARVPVARAPLAAGLIALLIGAYDGFFGPGTGTWLILAFAWLLGDGMARASGEAKVVNFASNLAAVALFGARGVILWRISLPMAAAQLAGGTLGAHLTVRRGDLLVRWVVLLVVIALLAKLGHDVRALF